MLIEDVWMVCVSVDSCGQTKKVRRSICSIRLEMVIQTSVCCWDGVERTSISLNVFDINLLKKNIDPKMFEQIIIKY